MAVSSFDPDRLKPARPNFERKGGCEPTRLQVGPFKKTAMKNPARACARRGSVNLSVDAGAFHPAESPSPLPCSVPNLRSGRDWRAQCHGRVATNMAAVRPRDMFSLCVMALDMNERRDTCNPFRRKFFSSRGFSKFRTADRLRISAENSMNGALQIPGEPSFRYRCENLKFLVVEK
jgi:hypothetical protein